MTVQHPPHRASILVEDARVIAHTAWEADQYVLVLSAPRIAARSKPGSFVHLTCDPHLPMRRPLSLQSVDVSAGTIEILYKVIGEGTRRLSAARVGDTLSCMGPIGNGFSPDPTRPRALLIGGGVGLPPMVFLAEKLAQSGGYYPLVLLGSEVPFPFRSRPSSILVNGIPDVFRIIVRHGDFHARRELFLDFGQRGADGLDDIKRVGRGQHPYPDEGRLLAVEADVRVVTLRAQLDVGDVFEPHDGVVLLPDHQLAEFFGGFEIGVGHQIHGNHRALGGAERGEIVVIGQGLAGLRGRDIQRGHAVGL